MGREKGRRKEREKVREGEGRKGGRLRHGFFGGMDTPAEQWRTAIDDDEDECCSFVIVNGR